MFIVLTGPRPINKTPWTGIGIQKICLSLEHRGAFQGLFRTRETRFQALRSLSDDLHSVRLIRERDGNKRVMDTGWIQRPCGWNRLRPPGFTTGFNKLARRTVLRPTPLFGFTAFQETHRFLRHGS